MEYRVRDPWSDPSKGLLGSLQIESKNESVMEVEKEEDRAKSVSLRGSNRVKELHSLQHTMTMERQSCHPNDGRKRGRKNLLS